MRGWAKSCLYCQRSKVHQHAKAPIEISVPAQRFGHIHIDLVGPLPPSQGTIMDRFTSEHEGPCCVRWTCISSFIQIDSAIAEL